MYATVNSKKKRNREQYDDLLALHFSTQSDKQQPMSMSNTLI